MIDVVQYTSLLNQYLDKDFSVYYAEGNLPSLSHVQEFEELFRCKFPDDFKVFITSYLNGFYAEAKEDVWPRRKGGAYWMFQYGLMVYGLDSELPDWISLRHEVIQFRNFNKSNLIPCMKTISSSDPYCFTPTGKLVIWQHEIWEVEPVEKNFFEAFRDELIELSTLKEKAKKELRA